MVRKLNLLQHLCKEPGNRGILNFAAQAKLIVGENSMNYFLEKMVYICIKHQQTIILESVVAR